MDISQYAKKSKLPLKSLRFMAQKGWIENPLTELDLVALELVENIWMNREILRPQLAQFSKKRRQEFLEKVDLTTKWERYAFSRFRNLPAGEKIGMKQLIDEIEMTFNFTLNWQQTKQLYRIRQKVYHLRMKEKRLQKPANK